MSSSSYAIVDSGDAILGRRVRAVRDISPDEVIMRECPLVWAGAPGKVCV